MPSPDYSQPDTVIQIRPRGRIDAVVTVPGSKSYTNRALVAAALADGRSTLRNALRSDDTRYMSRALDRLGIEVSERDDGTLLVEGCGGAIPIDSAELFVGNAGTAMRFLTAALTLGGGSYLLDGDEHMQRRPIEDLLHGLRQLGADVHSVNDTGCPPVKINARGLRGGTVRMPGNKSSQYFSAILMAAPYAAGDVEIIAEGALVSKPYVEMTIGLMRDFGVEAQSCNDVMRVRAGRHYQPRDYTIECDASAASYFFAAAAVTGGRVRVVGLSGASLQGDVRFVHALAQMGCRVSEGKTDSGLPYIEVHGGPLSGIEIDMGHISDVSLTLAAAAVFAEGPTRIFNVANMRIKETDRISALATELRRIGQKVEELPDGFVIHPRQVKPASIDTYDDHRMAMSFAIVGLGAPGIAIRNPSCVSKTFPDFFRKLDEL
ncbi:MAG: 3-phosphoshikimate 1-carboxyvinyltransferase [Planctomycetes bacterium]|nr:3-phosphoshikimate 1-carboxyvinyltransferase [Planctomycetota bacterium]